MKRIYLLISSLLIVAICSNNAQANPGSDDLMKAKYLYQHLAFNEAIPYYEKIAENFNDPEIYAQLGDCYRLTKDPQKAVVYYAKAVSIQGVTPLTKLHYAQTLMSLQKYDDALPWLKQYQMANPAERRVANLITAAEKAKAVYAQIPEGVNTFLPFNTEGNEFGPSLRQGDLLFAADTIIGGRKKTDMWTGSPYYNIYAVKCDSLGNCNNEFKKIGKNLNTKFHDGPTTFSNDGKTALFTRTNFVHKFLVDNARKDEADVVHLQIMMASGYDNASNEFASIKPFPYNNKNYSTAHPTLSPSGNILVFCSDMPGTEGGTDLYICKRDDKGQWSQPENLGKSINTEGEEMFPYLLDDYTLYFASDGWVGLGGLDIYKSEWDNYAQVFTTPENLGIPINSASDDMSIAIASTGKSAFFASNRVAPKGGDNIYKFDLQKVHFQLTIVDEYSDNPVAGCKVSMQSIPDNREFITDANGYALTRVYPQAQYKVTLTKFGYQPQTFDLSTISKLANDTMSKFIKLKPNTEINYSAVILDAETRQPIENPMVVMLKVGDTKKPDTVTVPTGESFNGIMQTNASYQVYAIKPLYYSDEKLISTKGIIPGANDKLQDTIFMKKLAPNVIIKIENIYYNFNKADIREDAKPSLNRLIDVLQQNPTMTIQLNAHTDCRGSDAYNNKLSNARAASVVKYLIEKGISADRLQSKGYGETDPIDKCDCKTCTEEQYQMNRRTEFKILKM